MGKGGRAMLYALFAAIATLTNIATQALCIRLWMGGHPVLFSLFFGTLAGLVPKYFLDKRYIFRFQARDAAHDGRLFVLYTAMAVFTTMIFWAVEFAFDFVFDSEVMRYIGGVIGLSAGYVAKYHLDKRFVFSTRLDS
jgi:putative flippase GtrA